MTVEFDPQRLATVQLVPLTPFSADGQDVEVDTLEGFIHDFYAAGVRVFLPGAGTGEFYSLTCDEIATCVAAVRRAAGPECTVIGPVGFGIKHALEAGNLAIEAGADAILVMPPVHPYLCDAGLRDYYEYLMDRLPKPFLFYKRGPFPSDDLLLDLAKSDQVVGIKYSSPDINAFTKFAQECDNSVVLSCGLAERFAPSFMMAGARAFTSGAANLCPRLSLALHRALATGDYPQAAKRLEVLRAIEDFRARQHDSYNISMLKFGLKVVGYDFGPVRPPMRQLTPEEQQEIKALLEPVFAYEAGMTQVGPIS